MKTSIETIYGNKFTFIWHMSKPADNFAGFIEYDETPHGYEVYYPITNINGKTIDRYHLATALRRLPLHPKPDDAKLLYRYASEGLEVHFRREHIGGGWKKDYSINNMYLCDLLADMTSKFYTQKITHATNMETSEVVEVAITEGTGS